MLSKSKKPLADVLLSAVPHDPRSVAGLLLRLSPGTPGERDKKPRTAIVYGFRAAPNEITDALSWILPPGQPGKP